MNYLFYLYELLLLLYTGWRTVDFMSNQLPKGGDNTLNLMLSIAFLASTEIGMIVWHFLGRKNANTNTQEQTAKVMTWVDFAGSLGAGVADMVLHQTLLDGYTLPPIIGYILLYVMPLIVAANVGAGLIYGQNDAAEMLERKQRQIDFAKTDMQLEVQDQTIKELKENKRTIARNMRKDTANVLRREVMQHILKEYGIDPDNYDGVSTDKTKAIAPPVKAEISTNGNGHRHEAETVAPLKGKPAKPQGFRSQAPDPELRAAYNALYGDAETVAPPAAEKGTDLKNG